MDNWTSALIICNGILPSRKRIAPLLDDRTLIICADGGANRALTRLIMPHVIIGDLDSLTPETAAAFGDAVKIRITDQESTDLEKALDYALRLQIGRATVIGATGRRPDHELANFSILAKYHRKVELEFVDSWCSIRVIDRPVSLPIKPGTTVSLMPLGRCEGITTHGLRYPLHDEALELGVREGNSNMVTESPVRIRLTGGKLLFFIVDRI